MSNPYTEMEQSMKKFMEKMKQDKAINSMQDLT